MEVLLVIIGISTLIWFRVLLGYADKNNIRSSAADHGWRDIRIKWSPFAPGAFFEKNERHYLVDYTDVDGVRRSRYCKTSILTGVYWR